MTPEGIAKTCYEVNRGLCISLGDNSQTSWEEAPDWQRRSDRDGVEAILDGRVTRPEQSHENWLEMKDKEGWKYGSVKDVDKKLHPCMVDFDHLPIEQQLKDVLFFTIVKTLS